MVKSNSGAISAAKRKWECARTSITLLVLVEIETKTFIVCDKRKCKQRKSGSSFCLHLTPRECNSSRHVTQRKTIGEVSRDLHNSSTFAAVQWELFSSRWECFGEPLTTRRLVRQIYSSQTPNDRTFPLLWSLPFRRLTFLQNKTPEHNACRVVHGIKFNQRLPEAIAEERERESLAENVSQPNEEKVEEIVNNWVQT